MTETPGAAAAGFARLLSGWWFLPLIGLAVIVLVALASLSPQRTSIALTVRTRSITVRADDIGAKVQAWNLNGPGTPLQPGQTAWLTGRFITLPAPVAPADPSAADPSGTIEVAATGGELRMLDLPPSASLRIELVPAGGVAYTGVVGDVSATVALRGLVGVAPSPARAPATLEQEEAFVLAGAKGLPLRLVLHPSDPANLGVEELAITELRFSRLRLIDDGRTPFRSDVTGGTLRLLDVARDVELRTGDPIWLDGFTGNLARVTIEKGELVADIVGKAHRVAVGPEIAKQDLTPSLLAWLIGQQSLILLWGAVVAVCGILAKVWEWARANLK
jgi:hypothetical protein